MLSRLANTNVGCSNPTYFKLDALFMYNATLIEIHPNLILKILAGYEDNKYWAHLCCHVQANEDLSENKAMLPFITKDSYRLDIDPYMVPRPESLTNALSKVTSPQFVGPAGPENSTVIVENSMLPPPNKTKLLYQVNKITSNLCLYILPTMAPDILQIVHRKDHPCFSYCYKIITRS